MAAGGLLAVLDDITLILDDVAVMSKVAVKKTAAIVGDDLAVNANVVVGIDPKRELPVVGKIALGSLANKALLIPLALALPTGVIQPLLMFGGAFLCYEALHKVTHKKVTHKKDGKDDAHASELRTGAAESPDEPTKDEKDKVWGAIGTDAILSAEVIAVALGAVAAAPMMTKAITLTVVGIGMTIGVYGLVAAIVKADDLGLHLQSSQGEGTAARWKRGLGGSLVSAMPKLMKLLSVLGTLAMFTVGGGILLHGIPGAETWVAEAVASITTQKFLAGTLEMVATLIVGVAIGALSTPIFTLLLKGISKLTAYASRVWRGSKEPSQIHDSASRPLSVVPRRGKTA